jgi:hypothetical protein
MTTITIDNISETKIKTKFAYSTRGGILSHRTLYENEQEYEERIKNSRDSNGGISNDGEAV